MALPTLMYATIAYIDRNTSWDDVNFHLSRRYDSNSMWQYVRQVCSHAERSSVRILDITVKTNDGEQVWNWRPEGTTSQS